VFLNLNEREFEKVLHLLHAVLDSMKDNMAAIDNLTTALAAQTTSVQALTAAVMTAIPEINPVPGTGATEAQVQAFADQVTANNAVVDAQTAAIVKATTPPAPVS
jgi:hypothetical protein